MTDRSMYTEQGTESNEAEVRLVGDETLVVAQAEHIPEKLSGGRLV